MTYEEDEFTLVYEALELALSELHNMIATCPDVTLYADDIKEIRAKETKIKALMAKLEKNSTTYARWLSSPF